ncbi:MAG: cytochrome c oxidase subunit 3 [Micavibrio sp.]|nr:MAG: cytochrome c oxidase subunit 3 [Micavibrio sp.]
MADNLKYDFKSGKEHPYHIVRPSPWPFFGALAAGLLAVGAVMFMHEVTLFGLPVGLKGLILGFVAVLAVMVFWWKDVIYEAVVEKAHTPVARVGMRYGMALFIASEVMFFFAFFWAFFNASLFPTEAIGGVWPPPDIEILETFKLPLLMTLVLLLSGCTVTWAHHAILEGNNKDAERGLLYTVLLGIFFTILQAYEYMHATYGFTEGVYPSVFYMATGFHGFHVIIGTIFLAVCYFRVRRKHFTPDSHFGFEAAAWYWHFVDVVWLFLFCSVYWWGNAGG